VPELDPRDARIAELEAKVAWLMEEVARLRTENQELRAQMGRNSQNSSKPPSSDPPGVERPKKEPTGCSPGGQPGHKGHKRELLEPDEVVALRPERCSCCGRRLHGEDPAPRRHQVVDLPPVKPHITEYQLAELGCECGARTRAELPVGVPAGAFGPRVTAMVAICTGKFRMSKWSVQELLADFCGVKVGLGSISKMEQAVSAAVAPAVEAAEAHVRTQAVVHPDETGWRERGQRRWLWTATTGQVSVFCIDRSRGADVAKRLLGEDFAGVTVSDRWYGYNWLDPSRRQLCWAHLIRDFTDFVGRGEVTSGIGTALLRDAKKMFRWWHRVRDGTLSRQDFQRRMRPVERSIRDMLWYGTRSADAKTSGTCRDILKHEPALFTFVREEGIEPTNNSAERALRHAVIWRKVCFGTWSADGSAFVSRILTVVTTLRQQGRHALDYVTAACTAALHDQRPASLLPVPASSRA
jgi:transposase